jgi:Fe2+ transport system protein FeoA
VRIVAIRGGWAVRQRLQNMGLHPGDFLVVKRSAALGGPQLVDVHGTDVALGRGMARNVWVEAAP